MILTAEQIADTIEDLDMFEFDESPFSPEDEDEYYDRQEERAATVSEFRRLARTEAAPTQRAAYIIPAGTPLSVQSITANSTFDIDPLTKPASKDMMFFTGEFVEATVNGVQSWIINKRTECGDYSITVDRTHILTGDREPVYVPTAGVPWSRLSAAKDRRHHTPAAIVREQEWSDLGGSVATPQPEPPSCADWELHGLQVRYADAHRAMVERGAAPSAVRRKFLTLDRAVGALRGLQVIEEEVGIEPSWSETTTQYTAGEILGWADGSLRELVGVWSEPRANGVSHLVLSESGARVHRVSWSKRRIRSHMPSLRVTGCTCARSRTQCSHRDEAKLCASFWMAMLDLDEEGVKRALWIYVRSMAYSRGGAMSQIIAASERGGLVGLAQRIYEQRGRSALSAEAA